MMHIVNFGTKKHSEKNSYMRKVEIEIPDGKMAKWVNDVLTLVDDKKPQDLMGRIKTFEDAVAELSNRAMNGDKDAGKLLDEWKLITSTAGSKDLLAYLKLRIITYALNEGWKPKFEENELRYYPLFNLKTSRGGGSAGAGCGLVYENTYYASSYSNTDYGSCLAFKSRKLAEYAGKQFVEIYECYRLI